MPLGTNFALYGCEGTGPAYISRLQTPSSETGNRLVIPFTTTVTSVEH